MTAKPRPPPWVLVRTPWPVRLVLVAVVLVLAWLFATGNERVLAWLLG